MKTLSRIYNTLIFIFLYAPIVVLIVFSFNNSKNRAVWHGFTTKWYSDLFHNDLILDSLKLTLLVAFLAAIIATVIGTAAAVGMYGMNAKLRKTLMAVNNIPMVNPEIVTGISMMLMFVFLFRATGLLKLGFGTLLLAHITFCIPYVVLQVMPKLRQMNKHMYEAALDLGCHPLSAFFKVVLPEILPGVLSGFMLAVTLSLDDYIVTAFVKPDWFDSISTYVYNSIKVPQQSAVPQLRALSAIIFVLIIVAVLVMNIPKNKQKNRFKEKID